MRTLSDLIAITSISLLRNTDDGRRLVAMFDVEIAGIAIKGCALVRTEKGGVAINTPHVPGARERGVWFTDALLHNAVIVSARKAYRALGGNDLPAWAMKADEPSPEASAGSEAA
jgi:hypothetical protein